MLLVYDVDNKEFLTKLKCMWHGEEIACSPAVLLDKSVPGLLWKCARDKHYGLKRMFRFYYDNNPLTEDGRIRVENMKADVLLLASENDDCWPSEVSAKRVDSILKNTAIRIVSKP